MKKKFPQRDPVLKAAAFLDPEKRQTVSYADLEMVLQRFPDVVPQDQYDNLFDEYAAYQLSSDDIFPKSTEDNRVRLNDIWHSIGRIKLPSSESQKFPTLGKVARFLMLIPHSNAFCETLFNVVRKVSTDVRSQLGKNTQEGRSATSVYATQEDDIRNTLVGILATKVNLFSACECHEWKPSKDLLLKAKSVTYQDLTMRQSAATSAE